MFNYKIEIFKGILFVRLNGILNKTNISDSNKEIIPLILKNGIKNVIFNLNDVIELSNEGIDFFNDNQKAVNFNNGQMIICNLPNNISLDNKKFKIVPSEIKAIRLLSV